MIYLLAFLKVIISVLKYTPLRITPNFFIVSLAAADLVTIKTLKVRPFL